MCFPPRGSQDPVRSAVVDSSIHVIDNGRKCIRGKVFFVFTLCDTSNYDVHVKLGARNPEEAAKWIKSFQELSQKVYEKPGNITDLFSSKFSSRVCDKKDVDGILSLASIMDPKTSEINEPSYWTIFDCHNGLRLFKQANDQESHNKINHHALAAVSVIEESPDVVFQTLMSLGASRSQWDFCFQKGSVIETIDIHTDIIHKQLNRDWLPWCMKRRDLLLHRYWRREENGTYIIFYHSVPHNKCPPKKGFVRARVKCGGYVISPGNQYKQSVVRHVLAIDWKSWRPYLQKSSSQCLTIRMLERLSALRELFKTNLADYLLPEFSSRKLEKVSSLSKLNENTEQLVSGLAQDPSDHIDLMEIDDQSDEFFDFSEPLFADGSEDDWAAKNGYEILSQDLCDVNTISKNKNDFVCELSLDTRSVTAAVQRKGCTDMEKIVRDECLSYNYMITLPKDEAAGILPNSWSAPKPSVFQIRGETFLEDRKKIPAESTLLQTVAVDWLKSNKREDHLASRPGNIVQKYAADGRPEFFIIANFQVPGSTTYNLAFYYTTCTPIKDVPLLERFIEGDDAFRNSRLKIIPNVAEGPWVLKQTIRIPTLIGNMLTINYIRGANYLEMDIDVGSSAAARLIAGKTFSCFTSLIIEVAFVIQANTRDELPEHLLGACRMSYLDVSKAVWANP
uniref:protein ENHANCED DISEASE RESISTANCE 2-like isoform X2 n=1 Tax=Erigeron canadensis TaxID=72917 RepID=UPI001CB91556|nr:protein ENHANCED DISEASE RESISTANCE 2-like isoform X2 [Erigeron canadensis]